jgi:hypothetical protein
MYLYLEWYYTLNILLYFLPQLLGCKHQEFMKSLMDSLNVFSEPRCCGTSQEIFNEWKTIYTMKVWREEYKFVVLSNFLVVLSYRHFTYSQYLQCKILLLSSSKPNFSLLNLYLFSLELYALTLIGFYGPLCNDSLFWNSVFSYPFTLSLYVLSGQYMVWFLSFSWHTKDMDEIIGGTQMRFNVLY